MPKWAKKDQNLYFSHIMGKYCTKPKQIIYQWIVVTKTDIFQPFSWINGNLIRTRTPKGAQMDQKVQNLYFSLITSKNCAKSRKIMFKWVIVIKSDIFKPFLCINGNLVPTRTPKMSPNGTKKAKICIFA